MSDTEHNKKSILKLNLSNRSISTELPAFIMGIVNCTPDSFFENSRGGVELAKRLIDEGADILDIGGESTRPDSEYVCAEEEISRIVPVIKEIRKFSGIPISVDTRKKSVMEAAYREGADILNDVSALEDDELLAEFAAETKIPVILMHKRGIPSDMQKQTKYDDVFAEVNGYLKSRADYAVSKGVSRDKIILDPGIGFGKDFDANRILIERCGEICNREYPVLMALSRKTCIGQMTGREKSKDRLFGTLAADIISVQKGATLVRVHDVAECRDTLKVLSHFL